MNWKQTLRSLLPLGAALAWLAATPAAGAATAQEIINSKCVPATPRWATRSTACSSVSRPRAG